MKLVIRRLMLYLKVPPGALSHFLHSTSMLPPDNSRLTFRSRLRMQQVRHRYEKWNALIKKIFRRNVLCHFKNIHCWLRTRKILCFSSQMGHLSVSDIFSCVFLNVKCPWLVLQGITRFNPNMQKSAFLLVLVLPTRDTDRNALKD